MTKRKQNTILPDEVEINNKTEIEKEKIALEEEFEEDFEEVSMEERILNIEKKTNATFILLIIVMLMVLISLIYSVSNQNNNMGNSTQTNNNSSQTSDGSYDTSMFTEITAQDIATLSKTDTIVIMIGRQGCGWCAEYAPMFVSVAKEFNVTPYYIDLAKILDFSQVEVTQQVSVADETAYNTIISLTGNGEWATFAKDKFGATPQTLVIKNNKVVGGLSGYPKDGESAVREAFQNAGLKK